MVCYVINLDENSLNRDIMEKLKMTIDFYKEKEDKFNKEYSVSRNRNNLFNLI